MGRRAQRRRPTPRCAIRPGVAPDADAPGCPPGTYGRGWPNSSAKAGRDTCRPRYDEYTSRYHFEVESSRNDGAPSWARFAGAGGRGHGGLRGNGDSGGGLQLPGPMDTRTQFAGRWKPSPGKCCLKFMRPGLERVGSTEVYPKNSRNSVASSSVFSTSERWPQFSSVTRRDPAMELL